MERAASAPQIVFSANQASPSALTFVAVTPCQLVETRGSGGGLIAEEVAKVYPEMVAYGNDGQILTVKYQLLAPMLLNEAQKQAEHIRSQDSIIRQLLERLAALEAKAGLQNPGH